MSKIQSVNKIRVHEVDDEETGFDAEWELSVMSHRNDDTLVVLKYQNGPAITVEARALERAITNATNVGM